MKQGLGIFIFLFAAITTAFAQPAYVENELIVQFREKIEIENFITDINNALAKGYGVYPKKCLSKSLNIWLIGIDEKNSGEIRKAINRHPSVIKSQRNHYLNIRETPNDSLFAQQWNLNNTGQNGGSPGADIRAEQAWNITTGGLTALGDTVVIAVLDVGFDLTHPDLAGNFWKNYHEIPNNGIDDDNNGFVDDVRGWNTILSSDSIINSSHGTPVASVIGARGNNSTGMSGVCWNVKLMPIVIAVTEASAVEGYSYILDFRKKYNADSSQGAFVVATNASFGIDFAHPDSFPIWCSMYDSLGKYGILNCAATINADQDVDAVGDMPTTCQSKYLISVTSTTSTDQKDPGTGYGKTNIDLGAPGRNIFGAYPNNNYGMTSGTSFAAPHVAGAIGLIYSGTCSELIEDARVRPDTVASLVKSFILDGTDLLPSLFNKTVSGGRLNVYKSLLLAENYGNCYLASVDEGFSAGADQFGILELNPNPAKYYIKVKYQNIQTGNNRFVICNALGQKVKQIDNPIMAKGIKTEFIDVSDLPAGMYFIYIASGYKQSNMAKFIVL